MVRTQKPVCPLAREARPAPAGAEQAGEDSAQAMPLQSGTPLATQLRAVSAGPGCRVTADPEEGACLHSPAAKSQRLTGSLFLLCLLCFFIPALLYCFFLFVYGGAGK